MFVFRLYHLCGLSKRHPRDTEGNSSFSNCRSINRQLFLRKTECPFHERTKRTRGSSKAHIAALYHAESNTGSNELIKVQLNYISEDDCKKSYAEDLGSRWMPRGLISSLICAGIMEGGKDTCQVRTRNTILRDHSRACVLELKKLALRLTLTLQGDSGGPLQRVLAEPYCMYSIVGVTSFGKFCAFKLSPAIYTKVSSYLDWIETTVWP